MDYKFVILANVGLIAQNKVPLNTTIDLEFFSCRVVTIDHNDSMTATAQQLIATGK